MKDVHAVLRDKEQDLERIRREIQALLVVIPLLAEEQSLSENVQMNVLTVAPVPVFMELPRKPQQQEPFSQLLTSWLSSRKI